MKPFIDPNDRPIEPPIEPLDDLHFADNDFPSDSFAPTADHTNSTETNTNDVPTTSTQKTQNHTQDSVSKTLIDNREVFQAEKLLKSRRRQGNQEYLVKWANYPVSEATWEPMSNI